ncbi:pleckstrin homology domain-containing family O member 1-A [Pleuronectes platessa]|uniref:pleckstrin homology domain-containing family O member 1-A n=1 Tax=Pleuronectes platessa TaxID=8262 RepID=UPI00232A4F32|nr:pleckstrin homology domain-containing family O member 1-A [Pleuronectes platessa]
MKKSSQSRRGVQDSGQPAAQQLEKVGWIRKFCGRGIFRELWRNRYVVLRGDHLYISDKEVRDERKAQEVFDLADYERSEELRKTKSRSKKNHSRFTLLRCRRPGNTVPNLVFLAVSPEEKESWVHVLNVAVITAKNRVLDQVSIEENSALAHLTRDRAKIPHGRRLPTRGHLLAVASTSSHGMLTLDLVAEEDGFSPDYDGNSKESWQNFRVDLQKGGQVVGSREVGGRQRAGTDVSKLRVTSKEPKVKTGSLPRGSEWSWGRQPHLEASKVQKTQQVQAQSRTPQPGKKLSMPGRSRCASMDEVLSSRPARIRSELRSALRRCPTEEEAGGGASVQPVGQLQGLIAQRMQRAQELLEEMRLQELQKAKAERERGLKGVDSPRLHHLRGSDSPHSSKSSGSPRSRSSESPRLRGKDSPRLRGRESPRSKAKKNRGKGAESPRSRGSGSPAAKANESPGLKETLRTTESPRSKSSDAVGSPNLKSSSSCSGPTKDDSPPSKRGSDSSGVKGSDSPQGSEPDSPCLDSSKESPCRSQKNSPSFSGLCESDQQCLSPSSPASPPFLLAEEQLEVERRRAEAERLLEEAVSSWKEAQEVLQEVKELQSQTLRRQRRRTYEKMSTAAVAGIPTASSAAEDEDTPASPTSPEDEAETP